MSDKTVRIPTTPVPDRSTSADQQSNIRRVRTILLVLIGILLVSDRHRSCHGYHVDRGLVSLFNLFNIYCTHLHHHNSTC